VKNDAEEPVAVMSNSSDPPRDEVREQLSTMFDRTRPAARKRTTVSVLGLDTAGNSGAIPGASGSTSISGPSFLGLDSGPPNADYLLEEEESGHGRGWLIAIVIILLLVLVGLQWRTEVQAQARRVAAVVKARMQPPAVKTEEASATSSDVKNPPIDATSTGIPGSASTTEATKPAVDQNSAKGSETGTTTSTPLAGSQPGKDVGITDATKSTSPTTAKDSATTTVAEKSTPPAEQQALPKAEKSTTTKDQAAANRAAAREPAPVDESSLMMAQKYLQGQGVPKSCERGMVYLKQAVRQPSPRARSQMGALYATGTCVPQNRVEAYRWFSSALDLDPQNPWLARERDMLYSEMTSTERQRVNQ
jgi:hypothetical protein